MKTLALAVLLALPALAQKSVNLPEKKDQGHKAERSESRAAAARAIDAEPDEPAEAEEAAEPGSAGKIPSLRVYRVTATSTRSGAAVGKLAKVASTLKGFGAQCVDINSLGLASGGSPYVESETYGILMHGRLTVKQRDELKSALCPGSVCQVKIKAVRVPLRATAIMGEPFGKEKPQVQLLSLVKKPLPRFSQSCADGTDTWTDTASTPEAKEYLKEAGIDFEKARTLELYAKGRKVPRIWSFGFPRNKCNSDPFCD